MQQTKGQPGDELKGPITFEINGEEDLTNPPQLVLSDQPIRYRLRLIKVDSETGKVITLAGTSFKLKDAQGAYVTQKVYYPAAQEIDTFTTDASGTVLLPETVTWGAYFIEEIQAPEGYLIREDDFAVFIGQDGDEPGDTYTVDIEIPDQPVKGRILANDSNFDRNPLRGCNYGLEGGAFLILGGCSSLPKEEECLHGIMC